MTPLGEFMAADLARPTPAGLTPLVTELQTRYGAALHAVVLYGSCRRDKDIHDGLVDLLVLVSSYRAVHGVHPASLLNRLLPPNVYFLQSDFNQQRLRSKYAIITLDQFESRCASFSDHYFWARFSQPARLLMSDNRADTAQRIAEARAVAARQFALRIAPTTASPLSWQAFWELAMSTTYRCELRPESVGHARRLIEADPTYWQSLTYSLAEEGSLKKDDSDLFSSNAAGRASRSITRFEWMVRRVTGKLFNLARLFKAAGTFSNGIDYITWKVERHSGVRVEPTERMRRHPRLAAWGLAWRLWRRGGFR